ncbi:hypothetical protein [Myxococcus landrumensis]|uniref:B box-type domain-containing protein n=1 Tax=Myxococcus landrumensis TaxID=2813577 RepID=A0ABX7N4K4_9BACT|nr:hypothetical protein [Myxococcus landrumus]QSQ12622.1 hypothetical protein JY572_30295 [Myxococcus landrumus]
MSSLLPTSETAPGCALHPQGDSVFTCSRCGSFGCSECRSSPETTRCEACVRRLREDPTVMAPGQLLADTFTLFRQHLRTVVLVCLTYAATFAGSMALVPLIGGSFTAVVSQLAIQLGLSIYLMREVAEGLREGARARPSGAGVLTSVLARVPVLFFMFVLNALVVMGGSLLFVLPGLYLALCTSLAPAAVAVDGKGPLASLRASYTLIQGYRLRLLGVVLPLVLTMVLASKVGDGLMALTQGLPTPLLFASGFVTTLMTMAALALYETALVLAYQRLRERQPTSPSTSGMA